MRCNGIKVTFEVPLTEVDGNGITYDLQTYKSKLHEMVGLPITNGSGGECYGVITDVHAYEYSYIVEGMLFAGGTAELMKIDSKYEGREDANGITNIEIQPIVYTDRIVSFGLSEDWSNQSGISLNKQYVSGFELKKKVE